jgi:hypothetical protein
MNQYQQLANEIKPIDFEDALYDFAQLRKLPLHRCNTISRIGNTCMDYYFFAERLRCKNITNKSFFDWMEDHKEKEYVKRFITNNNLEFNAKGYFTAFSLYGKGSGCSAFKPNVAKYIYNKYSATGILDFSAGWGGRCLAAMALNIPYTGFDTNTDLRPCYERMIYDCSGKNITMNFTDSSKADFSKISYDMIFTSPPYLKNNKLVEIYPNMIQYTDNDNFNETFYKPVLLNAWKYLKPNGVMVLNIPDYMLEDTEKIIGKHTEKTPMALQKRHDPNRKKEDYIEYLYVWRKPAETVSRNLPPFTGTADCVEIRKSSIPGTDMWGVFAKINIPANKMICEFIGRRISKTKFTALYGDDTRYTYQKSNATMIIAKEMPYLTENIINYVNESMNSNVKLFRGGLWSRRNVKADDELFLLYPESYPRDYSLLSPPEN